MKGYLYKVLGVYGAVYAIVNFGWIISSFYLMANSPEQMRVFALQGALIWLGCFIVGLALTAFLAKPVHDGLRKMAEKNLSDRELESINIRNRNLPYLLCMLMVVMITVFDVIVYMFYLNYDIGPIASGGLWVTNIVADLGLPICLYSALNLIISPAFNSIHHEFEVRSLPFRHNDIRLATKIVCLFCAVCIGIIGWMGLAGFYEGLGRIKEEATANMLSFERYIAGELKAAKGDAVTVEDMKPVIDRMASSGMGKPFLMSTQGSMLYNPTGTNPFVKSWNDIDRTIRETIGGGKPGAVYENVYERISCFTPVSRDYVIGLTSSLGPRMERFSRFFLVFGLLSLVVFGIVGFAMVALLMIIVVPVRKTVEKLEDLSTGEGDLTARLIVHSSDEMGELASRFNAFVGGLEEIITDVKRAAGDVDSTSHDVSSDAESLTSSLQEQMSAVEILAQTIEKMTTSIKHNAASAEQGRDKTRAMVNMANSSEESMRTLVNAMDEVSLASRKIGDIISTVNEVAFQTNLLALNAAVEAARAGEHGKGFAIVAQEVRALAQRSSAAALEIRRLIEDTVSKIKAGDAMAKSTSGSIASILQEINDISQTIEEFAVASAEQSGDVDELNKTVFQIDSVTQKNAATVEDLAGSANNMLSAAGRLAGDVDRFKVSQDFKKENRPPKLKVLSGNNTLQRKRASSQPRRAAASEG